MGIHSITRDSIINDDDSTAQKHVHVPQESVKRGKPYASNR